MRRLLPRLQYGSRDFITHLERVHTTSKDAVLAIALLVTHCGVSAKAPASSRFSANAKIIGPLSAAAKDDSQLLLARLC